MIQTGNMQINHMFYLNEIYKNDEQIRKYEIASLREEPESVNQNGQVIRKSTRMETIPDYVVGDKVIDLGCGSGLVCKFIQDKVGGEVWGMDISDEIIERNKKVYPDIKFVHGYIGGLSDEFPKEYFDTVTCGEVLEHLSDPNDLFKDAYSLLKDGGRFVVTCPKEDSVMHPEHVWYLDADDIRKLFEGNGFKEVNFVDLPYGEDKVIIFAYGTKGRD